MKRTDLLVIPIRGWQKISAILPPVCRFYPSCSRYAIEALEVHGLARGSWLAMLRICRCHPFHPGGHDPVPPPRGALTGTTSQTGGLVGQSERR